jgi:hypothetical protein
LDVGCSLLFDIPLIAGMHDDDYLSHCSTIIFLVCADNTTTEPQGTGRKRGHSDPEGADSEPGKCSYTLVSAALSPPFTTSHGFSLNIKLCVPAL